MVDLIKLLGVPVGSQYAGINSAWDFVESLAQTVVEQMDKEAKDKLFSLVTDESTDISSSSQITIMLKYIKRGTQQTKMLCLSEVEGKDSDAIVKTIFSELGSHGLQVKTSLSCSFSS